MSGVAIAPVQSPQYTIYVYSYVGETDTSYRLDVVVTKNTKVHHSIIGKEYSERNAVLVQNSIVEFESESITLDIPMTGITVGGWKLIPLCRPVVLKQHVDSYEPGMLIPQCQFSAKIDSRDDDYIPPLEHRVPLNGAKFPFDNVMFNIDPPVADVPSAKRRKPYLPRQESVSLDSGLPLIMDKDIDAFSLISSFASGEVAAQPPLSDISKPNMQNLTVLRWKNIQGKIEKFRLKSQIFHKWREIGTFVLSWQELEALKDKDPEYCIDVVLQRWLSSPISLYPATWEGLYELLDDCELSVVAYELKYAVENAFGIKDGLNGVELCWETLLTVTNAADTFSWEGYGLTVHVKENSLPQGTEKTELTVAASTTGQYEFPANSNLVSAVYWFEPKRTFEKQLMLEIQHCAKSDNASKLRFVTAGSSQKQLPYNFKPIDGGRFTSHGAYVYGSLYYSMRSLTPCGLAIVQDSSEEKKYYARLFYLSQSSLLKEMNFVITLGTDAHITESKTKYEEMNALIGYEGSIDFESDRVTLDIPEVGISDHNGWKLSPKAPLAVSKKEVDSFTLGKKTPHCKLLAEEVEPSKSRTLHYVVHLKGAKHPHNIFNIHIEGSENVRRYKAYETALQNGLALNLRYLKFLFFGPPRSGKSTTRQRLLQEILNLHSLGELSVSTGVAEMNEVVIKKLTSESVAITDSQWCSMKKNDKAKQDMYSETELEYFAQLIYQSIQSTSVVPALLNPDATNVSENNIDIIPKSDDKTSNTNTEENSEKIVSKPDDTLDITEAEKLPSSNEFSATEILEVENAVDKLKKILQSDDVEELKQLLEEITLVNMADVGGQPALLDMVPALTIGPALYLLFFRLDQNLKQSYPVRFLASDSKAEITLKSYYCIEDVLHQCLASVVCFGCISSQENTESASKPRASSRVVLFGTYKDQVNDDKITKVDTMLQEIFAESKLYKEGLLLKSSSGKMFFAVDNMKGTEESEMSTIRKEIEDIIKAYFPPTPVPASWLMFRIVLHLLKKTLVSLAQCKEIAKQLSMLSTVEDALWYFHRTIGSLMHYSNIPSMKDIVICNPQVIFDSVSKLIIEKFQYGNRALKPCEVDEFHETGQFTMSHIKDTTEQQRSDLLSPDQLVDVLKYHNVLVELKPDQQSGCPTEPKFIMPSTLKYASEEELKSLTVTDSKEVPSPLIISFEGGFVPFGVFCAATAHLIAHQDSLSPKWKLCKAEMMKNKVLFCIANSFYATLISRPQYLEIHLEQDLGAESKCSLQNICNKVRQEVVKTLETVIENMKYRPLAAAQPSPTELRPFHLAFPCTCRKSSRSGHLMKVFEDQCYGVCPYTHSHRKLKPEYLNWINQPEEHPESNTSGTEDPPVTKKRKYHISTTLSHDSKLHEHSGVPVPHLCDRDHSDIYSKLKSHASRWRDIGGALGFLQGELDNIQSRPLLLNTAPEGWLKAMLDQWLQWAPGDCRSSPGFPTKESLQAALLKVNLGGLAQSMQEFV